MKRVIEVYTKDNCPWCERAKQELSKRWREGITIVYHNISSDPALKEDMFNWFDNLKLPRPKTVPQIFIDKHHIGGYDDLMAYFQETDWSV